jgi:hypothetical protein
MRLSTRAFRCMGSSPGGATPTLFASLTDSETDQPESWPLRPVSVRQREKVQEVLRGNYAALAWRLVIHMSLLAEHFRCNQNDPFCGDAETCCIRLRVLTDYSPFRQSAATVDDGAFDAAVASDIHLGQVPQSLPLKRRSAVGPGRIATSDSPGHPR